MIFAARFMVGLTALLHLSFLYLEMFLWNTAKGQKILKIDAEFAEKSAALAANQGLYNGFMAAGLIWSLASSGDPLKAYELQVFFLSCVIIAGFYGALTVSRSILFIQSLPALLGLIFLMIGQH